MGQTVDPFFVPGVDDEDTVRRRRALVRSIERDARGDRPVIHAMLSVPRHAFVPPYWYFRAYEDGPLTIGHGQTISQPAVVAMMTFALRPEPHHTILEVGTGSGYQTAVLSRLVKRVETVEIIEPLAVTAAETLRSLGYDNVRVHVGDGYDAVKDAAPFDGIMVTAAPERVPEGLLAQLRDGGRMVLPVGPEFGIQDLIVLRRRGNDIERKSIAPVRFVPMVKKDGTAR